MQISPLSMTKAVTYIFGGLFFFVSTLGSIAQTQPDFRLGFADSLKSTLLQEQRHLLIYTPYAGKKTRTTTKETYPVLYVLDAETNFRSVAITVERLASMGVCPPLIVIGLLNTNRSRDFTPTAATNTDGIKQSGGGERFLSFLEKELIPYIDSVYPTAPYKLLMGHSLGGLLVMHTLVHHKDLFNAYVAMDAAIWWDNHKLLTESKTAFEAGTYSNKTLFLAMANRMEKGVDTTAVQSDTSEQTELIRYNLAFMHLLQQQGQHKLRFKPVYYENDTHGTVSFIAAYDALRFIFDYYGFPRTAAYQPTNPLLTSVLTDHFRTISNALGYQVLPDATLVNSLGYQALSLKQFDVAGQLFALNVRNHPEDANLLDSYGDYYQAVADKKNAAVWYRKALTIREMADTRSKLNALLNETPQPVIK